MKEENHNSQAHIFHLGRTSWNSWTLDWCDQPVSQLQIYLRISVERLLVHLRTAVLKEFSLLMRMSEVEITEKTLLVITGSNYIKLHGFFWLQDCRQTTCLFQGPWKDPSHFDVHPNHSAETLIIFLFCPEQIFLPRWFSFFQIKFF